MTNKEKMTPNEINLAFGYDVRGLEKRGGYRTNAQGSAKEDKLKFEMIVKKGLEEVARINGIVEVSPDHFTLTDAAKILEAEKFLERCFGLRFHIDQIVEKPKAHGG